MALVTTTEMFKKAYDGGYAIGAFNVNNMEIVQGITEAAARIGGSPDPAGVQGRPEAYANHTYLVKLVEAAVIECPDHPHRPASGPRRLTLRPARAASTAALPPS